MNIRVVGATICGLMMAAPQVYGQATQAATTAVSKVAVSKQVKLEKKKLGSTRNVHALGDVYLAGQPAEADLPALQAAGIKTVINIRKTKELTWDEAGEVNKLGMEYVHAPFQGPEELKSDVFDKVRKTLNDEDRGPTLFHCGSANRVGAIWYAHRILDGNISPEAALEEAKVVGLRTPAYLEQAKKYVAAIQQRQETIIPEPAK